MSPDEAAREAGPPSFDLVNLFFTKALFEFLGTNTPAAGPRPRVVSIALEVGASLQVQNDGSASFIQLQFKITPDQQWQPYRIEVTIGAFFRSDQSSQQEMSTFARVAAPPILFPYVRELVHKLTADAPNGPVRINPLNISQMLNETAWDVATEALKDDASSVPPRPSEQ